MEGVASGRGTGRGLWVGGDSTDFTVANMTIHGFETGIWAGAINGLAIRNNTIRNVSTDGIIAGNLHDGVISGNTIDLNAPSGRKHSDGIQFHNDARNTATTDLSITNNTIVTHNNQSHGIYMANNAANDGGGAASFFQNVQIKGNWVIAGDGFGISWGQTNHLDITGNIVIKDRHLLPEESVPSIRVAWPSTDVSITGNVVQKKSVPADSIWHEVNKHGANWQVSDKIIAVGSTLDAARASLAALKAAPPSDAPPQALDGGADVFRFAPKIGTTEAARGIDFAAGDTIELHDYAKGTFSGAFASPDGTSITIDSLAELRETARAPTAVATFEAKNDALALVIHQDDGNHQVRLIGLAHDYF
jgi:hypothetical protein